MNSNQRMRLGFLTLVVFTGAPLAIASEGCAVEECADGICSNTGSGAGGVGAQGGGGDGGAGGSGGNLGGGGNNPGGGGTGGVPDCVEDVDCTNPQNAHCDNGSCVPCTNSNHCVGVTGLPVCDTDNNTCVQCLLGEENACTGNNSCDLLAKECVPVAPGSVTNCKTCSNDSQCVTGHKCIPMEFEMAPHGHYCLKPFVTVGDCVEPFLVSVNQPSISGAPATDYCGIEQDLATCEAVNALLQNWVCTGNDGMCGPMGMPEQAVPGALCKQVGFAANKCTYACDSAPQCPSGAPQNTCNTGPAMGPWCGG